jgi:hypothetical protein
MTKTKTYLLVATVLCLAMPVLATPSQDINSSSSLSTARQGNVVKLAQFGSCASYGKTHHCHASWTKRTHECLCAGK